MSRSAAIQSTNRRLFGVAWVCLATLVASAGCKESDGEAEDGPDKNSGGTGGASVGGTSGRSGAGAVAGRSGGSAGSDGGASDGGASGDTGGPGPVGVDLVPCEGPDLGAGKDPSGGATPGEAVSLDGTDWVTISSAGNYVPTTGFTWEAWFKGSNLPTDTVPGTMDGASNGQMLFVVADGQGCVDANIGFGGTFTAPAVLSFTVDGPGGCGARDTTPVGYRPAGGFKNERWYHVAGVRSYDASCAGLYLDGALVASKATSVGPIQGAGFAASIGRWTDGGYNWSHFQGLIDEVRVYGRPLSADEIANHFNNGSGSPGAASEPGLVAGWHLDETSGTVATDFGANHLDGTYVGAATHAPGIVASPR